MLLTHLSPEVIANAQNLENGAISNQTELGEVAFSMMIYF